MDNFLTREAFETILGGEFVSLSDQPGRRSNEKFETYTNGEECFCRPVGKVDTRGHSWAGLARLMIYNGTLPEIKEIEPDGDTDTQTDNGGWEDAKGEHETESPPVTGAENVPVETVSFSLPSVNREVGVVGNTKKTQGNQGKSKAVRKG